LTSQQKAAMCTPGDKHVNATESRLCGIPMTPSGNTTTTSVNTTTTVGNTTTAGNTTASTVSPPFVLSG
jgi:hypothetical protein